MKTSVGGIIFLLGLTVILNTGPAKAQSEKCPPGRKCIDLEAMTGEKLRPAPIVSLESSCIDFLLENHPEYPYFKVDGRTYSPVPGTEAIVVKNDKDETLRMITANGQADLKPVKSGVNCSTGKEENLESVVRTLVEWSQSQKPPTKDFMEKCGSFSAYAKGFQKYIKESPKYQKKTHQ